MADEATNGWEMTVAPARSAPGVVSMTGYRGHDIPERLHRGLPSPTLTFIVSLDDGVEAAATAADLPSARPNPVILGGLHLRASHVQQRRGQAGVQLAVHPLASRALFGMPSAELPLSGFDGIGVLGRGARELAERLSAIPDWTTAFTAVADYLVDAHGRAAVPVRPEVLRAWHLLERSNGRIPLGELASRLTISGRHLTTLFRRELGVSPKTVAMLMRFQFATTTIAASVRRHGRADLAGVASAAGYFDQAHLTRDFIRFAGVPPRTWLAEEFRNIQDGSHAAGSQWSSEHFEPDGPQCAYSSAPYCVLTSEPDGLAHLAGP